MILFILRKYIGIYVYKYIYIYGGGSGPVRNPQPATNENLPCGPMSAHIVGGQRWKKQRGKREQIISDDGFF